MVVEGVGGGYRYSILFKAMFQKRFLILIAFHEDSLCNSGC